MAYDLIIGRDETDKAKYGTKGTVFLGKSFVTMGTTTSLSNNIYLDIARSHVVLVTGKRGGGKSYSLSVIAEEVTQMPQEVKENLSVLIFDTMGIFWTMKFPNMREEKLLREWGMKPESFDIDIYTPQGYFKEYKEKGIPTNYSFAIKTSDLSASDWCGIFEIKLTEPVGVVIEKVLTLLKENKTYSINDIINSVLKEESIDQNTKNATINRFIAARSWGLFDERGVTISELIKPGRVAIIDVSCYTDTVGAGSIKNLVIGYLCGKLISSRITARKVEEREIIEAHGSITRSNKKDLPMVWVMIDEAHEALPRTGKTPATDALVQLLREGRQPGISLVLATQQPGEIHNDVLTQTDIVISHKITAKRDVEALNSMMQGYLLSDISTYINNLPELKGSAIILDDNSERIYPLRVHPKKSWHGGETPSAVKDQKGLFKVDL